MGLAYNLDVKYWDNVSTYLSDAFVNSADDGAGGLPFFSQGGVFLPNWQGAWQKSGDVFCQGIFPTGECILDLVPFLSRGKC